MGDLDGIVCWKASSGIYLYVLIEESGHIGDYRGAEGNNRPDLVEEVSDILGVNIPTIRDLLVCVLHSHG